MRTGHRQSSAFYLTGNTSKAMADRDKTPLWTMSLLSRQTIWNRAAVQHTGIRVQWAMEADMWGTRLVQSTGTGAFGSYDMNLVCSWTVRREKPQMEAPVIMVDDITLTLNTMP